MSDDAGAGLEPGPAHPRLGRPGGQLGDHFRATDAHGAVQGQVGPHPVPEPARDRLGRPEHPDRPGHVEKGLVQPDGLDQRGDVGQDPVELPADLGVAAVTTGQEHGLRAELAGPHRRHGRTHPEHPGLVGARGHHAPGAGPADDDRQAGQRWDRRAPRPRRRRRPCRRAGWWGRRVGSPTERQPAEALGKGHPGAAALLLGPAPDGLAGPSAGLGELRAVTLDGGGLALDGL